MVLTEGAIMTTRMVLAFVTFAASVVLVPAESQSATRSPVLNQDLNQFIGRNLFGFANANLGVVSAANRNSGIVGIVGRHGEYARLSASLLARDGVVLYAPSLTAGDIKAASDANLSRPGTVLAAPHVIVIEPPAG